MSKAVFVVPVADIERGTRTVTFTLDEAWLRHALEGTDAAPTGPGSVTVELSKSGRDIMVRGRAEVRVSMPCVVTLDPLDIDLNPEIFLMLAPGAADAPAKAVRPPRKRAPGAKEGQPEARSAAPRQRKGQDEGEEGELLDPTTAARDTYEGSQIELDSFFREFIVLDLPMFPRRSDLPSSEGPAIGPPSEESGEQQPAIDPRLQPLAALRSRLRESKE